VAYANGRLPASALAPIGGGLYLRKDAARCWLALQAACRRKYGRSIRVADGYRRVGAPGDYPHGGWSQWYAWGRYLHGGNLAAHPGTSNHGVGITVDISTADRPMLNDLGPQYGWSKAWSDAQSEPWHIKWDSGHVRRPCKGRTGPRVIRKGSRPGKDIQTLQVLLRRAGYLPPKWHAHTKYTIRVRRAVRKFQRDHHLKVDGVIGPRTLATLKAAAKRRR
jgi:hypothetical protein